MLATWHLHTRYMFYILPEKTVLSTPRGVSIFKDNCKVLPDYNQVKNQVLTLYDHYFFKFLIIIY